MRAEDPEREIEMLRRQPQTTERPLMVDGPVPETGVGYKWGQNRGKSAIVTSSKKNAKWSRGE